MAFLAGKAKALVLAFDEPLVTLAIGEDVVVGRVRPLDAVERRHRQVHVPAFDEGAHVPVDEGQQQGCDVGSVDVGVGHEHDLVIAKLGHVEFVADARAEGRDETLDRVRGKRAVQSRFLNVEDLPANRHDRLVLGVAPVDGRPPRGVALDDEDLALFRVARRAVLELAGHRRRFEHALATCRLAGLARRGSGGESLKGLADDVLCLVRMHVKPVRQMRIDLLLNECPRLGVPELRLRLALELRIAELDRDDGRQALADVVARKVGILVLEQPLVPGVFVDHGGQRGAEALLVGSSLSGVDRVREGVESLRVGGGPLHRDLALNLLLAVLRFKIDDVRVDDLDLLRRVEMLDVVEEPSRIHVRDAAVSRRRRAFSRLAGDFVAFGGGRRPFVGERDAQVFVEEGHLAEAAAQGFEVVVRRFEDVGIGPERLRRSVLVGLRAPLEGARRDAVFKGDAPNVPVAAHFRLHSSRKGVDDGDADAVQPSGNRVSSVSELASGVQDRHDHFDSGLVLRRVLVHRDAPAVVAHSQAAVGQNRHLDVVADPGQRLIDRIVDHLVYAVVESAFTRRSDVHARAFADGFETLENGDRRGVVGLAF